MSTARAIFCCFLLLTLGCGGDGDGYPQTCQLQCEHAARCSPQGDPRGCAERCGATPYEPQWSKRYRDAVRRCLDRTPCVNAPGGDYCAREEALRLTPSKAAQDLCNRAYAADRYCGGSTLDAVGCLDTVKLYEDDLLRRTASCYDLTCRDQPSCVRERIGYGYPYFY